MARLDPGWNREDIDFDRNGRLVIKNPALAREVLVVLEKNGRVEATTIKPARGPQPLPDMCNCNMKTLSPKAPVGLRRDVLPKSKVPVPGGGRRPGKSIR